MRRWVGGGASGYQGVKGGRGEGEMGWKTEAWDLRFED